MNVKTIKEKIINGLMSDEELSALLSASIRSKRKSTFFKDILKGFIDGYTAPNMWKMIMGAILLFTVITGIIVLSAIDKMDVEVAAVLLAAMLGFLLGKIR